MFGAIAPRYDLLNHLLSGGLDLYWRRVAVRAVLEHIAPGAGRGRRRNRRSAAAPRAPAVRAGAPSPPEGARRARALAAEDIGAPALAAEHIGAPVLAAQHIGAPRPAGGRGYRVLDLCAGTLDLSCALSDSRRFQGRSVALDFALPMLRRGRHKLGGRRGRQILPLCGDALRLPFRDASFDAIMVAFGVRNLADLEGGLAEMRRVLVPGGLLLVLEFSQPENAFFRGLYGLYSRRVLPAVGGAVSGHPSAYRYLPASVAEFPDAAGLGRRIEEGGYAGVRWRTLSGGIVALHQGTKPAAADETRPARSDGQGRPFHEDPDPSRSEPA